MSDEVRRYFFLATTIFSWRPLFFHGNHYFFLTTTIFSWQPLFFHGDHYFFLATTIFSWQPLFLPVNREREIISSDGR